MWLLALNAPNFSRVNNLDSYSCNRYYPKLSIISHSPEFAFSLIPVDASEVYSNYIVMAEDARAGTNRFTTTYTGLKENTMYQVRVYVCMFVCLVSLSDFNS